MSGFASKSILPQRAPCGLALACRAAEVPLVLSQARVCRGRARQADDSAFAARGSTAGPVNQASVPVSARRRCQRRNGRRPALEICGSPDRPRGVGSRGPAFVAKENRRRAGAKDLGLVDCETAGGGGDRFSSDTKSGRRSLLLQPHSGSAVAQQSHCWAHSAPSGSSLAPIRRAVWAGPCAHRGVAVESRHGEHDG
jgi:hypothetical protein